MALPIKWSLPSLSEITSPSAGFPKTLSTSLENTQSCPCKIRARGLTMIPAISNSTFNVQRTTSNAHSSCHSERSRGISNPCSPFGNCFAQVLRIHFEYRQLEIFEHL